MICKALRFLDLSSAPLAFSQEFFTSLPALSRVPTSAKRSNE